MISATHEALRSTQLTTPFRMFTIRHFSAETDRSLATLCD